MTLPRGISVFCGLLVAGCGGAAGGTAPSAVVTVRDTVTVMETVDLAPAAPATTQVAVAALPKLPKGVTVDGSAAPELQILGVSKLKYVDIDSSDTTLLTVQARNISDGPCVFELAAAFYHGDELLSSQTDSNGDEPIASGTKATFEFFTAGHGRATSAAVDAITMEC